MLSDKEIRALMDGAYGVTRNGVQVKYMGKTKSCKYGWAKYRDGYLDDIDFTYVDFCSYWGNKESPLDIVGLWENRVKPFNLERALAGEMIVENNVHYWLVAQSRANKDEYILEDLEGNTTTCRLDELYNKFTMWKEPEPVKPSADDLPKPIREFGDLKEVWRIITGFDENRYIPYKHNKGSGWTDIEKIRLANGCYYATEEDCQKACDWLMNR